MEGQLSGLFTAVDIFRVLPHGGGVLKVGIKESLLERVLEYGIKSQGEGAYLQRFNASKLDGIWMIKGRALDNNKTYTVAFSDYLLKGLDIPFLSSSNSEITYIFQPKNTALASDT